jgi:hypothetical protein
VIPDKKEPPRASRALAAGLVADIMKQRGDAAKALKAEAAKPKRKKSVVYVTALLPLVLGLTLWNIMRSGAVPEVFSPRERAASIRFQIYLVQQSIEKYRDSLRVLPRSLAEIGLDGEGVTYVLSDTSYDLIGRADSLTITYHHGDALAPYSGAVAVLQRLQAK